MNPFVYLHLPIAYAGLFEFVNRFLEEVKAGEKILNIGAGGRIGNHIKEQATAKGAQVQSFDIDPSRKPDIVGDLTTYSFTTQYDKVFMCEVLEHIPEPQKALDNLLTGLKPGGTLVLTCPFLFPLHDRPYDYYRYTRYGLAYLLRAYDNVEIRERNNWAQAIALLGARLCIEKPLAVKLFSVVTITLAVLLNPLLWLLGKVLRTDCMASGYLVSALKKTEAA